MSSLEERREARRRRRAAEEDATGVMTRAEISSLVDARLQQKRLERQRRKEQALSVNGGEDDLERRRRERREAKLRGESGQAEEETTSHRSRRDRGGDEDVAPAEDSSSARSRRRRGGDEDSAAESTPASAGENTEEAAPAAEEVDSGAQDDEEERRRQEKEEEKRRQEEEIRRKQEEERRRKEEQRREEERRKRWRPHERDCGGEMSVSPPSDIRSASAGSLSDHGGPPPQNPLPSPPNPPPAALTHKSRFSPMLPTGRSALSECVFNYASDDAISDLASENQRMLEMSSDCDLGSSFDSYASSDHDHNGQYVPATSHNRRHTRPRGVSPLAAQPVENSRSGQRQDTGPGSRLHRLGPEADNSFASSQGDDDDDHFVPLSREHQGTMVEGDRANRDLLAYRALKRQGDLSQMHEESQGIVSPLKLQKRNSDSSSDLSTSFSRQDSEGFDYMAENTSDSPTRNQPGDTKRPTPFAYLSSGCDSSVSDRDEATDSSFEKPPPVDFKSKSPGPSSSPSPTASQGRSFHSPVHARLFLPSHQRSTSSPVDLVRSVLPGHQRSASSPSNMSDRHQNISSRMSELQRQLQAKTGNRDLQLTPVHKRYSHGDLRLSHSQARSQITDLISRLSDRLKAREAGESAGEELSPLSQNNGQPRRFSMPEERVMTAAHVTSLRRERKSIAEDSLPEEDEDISDDEDYCEDSHMSLTDPDSSVPEDSPRHTFQEHVDPVQQETNQADPSPLHANPTIPAITRPKSGVPHSRGGRPDKIKEEMRLCLDFLDEPAEDLDSEEEQDFVDVNQSQSVAPPVAGYYLDSSSCSSSYDMSPPAEYTETDDFAEDEASYAQVMSAYFSEDSFSQSHVPDYNSAWDRDRAASMPDISGRENGPFMSNLLRSVMLHPPSPPPPIKLPSRMSPPPPSFTPPASPPPQSNSSQSAPPSHSPSPPLPPPPPSPPPSQQQSSEYRSVQSLTLKSPPPLASLPPPPPPLPPAATATTTVTPALVCSGVKARETGQRAAQLHSEGEEDLLAMLCREILQLGRRRAESEMLSSTFSVSQSSSAVVGTGGVSTKHLLRPSTLKSGRDLRDWGPADSSGKKAPKQLQASEPVVSSFETHVAPVKRMSRAELNLAPRRKSITADSNGGNSLLSFWQKKEEITSPHSGKPPQATPSRSAGGNDHSPKPAPANTLTSATKSPSTIQTKASFSVAEKKKTFVSTWTKMESNPVTPKAETLAPAERLHVSAMSKSYVKTHVLAFSDREGTSSTENTTRKIPPPIDGTSSTENTTRKISPFTVGTSSTETTTHKIPLPTDGPSSTSNTIHKIPPPTLPKSSTVKGLPLPRSFILDKSAANTVPHGNSRFSSTSSLESDVFIASADNQPVTQNKSEPKKTVDSAREYRQRLSSDSNRMSTSFDQESGPSTVTPLLQNLLSRKDSYKAPVSGSSSFERWKPNRFSNEDHTTDHVDRHEEMVKEPAPEAGTSSSENVHQNDFRKKHAARKPRFDARRLTQDNPSVWKCVEDAKTEYIPTSLGHNNIENIHTPQHVLQTEHESQPDSCLQPAVSGGHKTEYKSWAADYLKDRIFNTTNSGNNSARAAKDFAALKSEFYPDSDNDSREKHVSVLTKAPPPVAPKPMSVSERINLLNTSQSPKRSTSSISSLKAGSISDREGPEEKPVSKRKPPTPSSEQKFASLLRNKLINVITTDDTQQKREEEEREATKKTPTKKMTPAEEIARSRAWGGSSKKPLKVELAAWSPELTSTPAPVSRTPADLQPVSGPNSGTVADMAKEFDNLSDSISKEDDDKRVSRWRGSRRLSTGLSVKEMKEMFDNPDSRPNSTTSSRNTSPKPVSSISERKLDRFHTQPIAENRPVVDRDMVPLCLTGPRNSVLDIVKKVEAGAQDIKVPAPRRPLEQEVNLGSRSLTTSSGSLHRVGTTATDDIVPSTRKGKMDKSRRYTTGVNFAELQLRFSQPEHFKKSNQSRAMSAIYASSQDVSRQQQLDTPAGASSSTRSMENLLSKESALGIGNQARNRLQKSAENLLSHSTESIPEKSASRSGSFLWDQSVTRSESLGAGLDGSMLPPPDIQSMNGSAFSRVSAVPSPIKVSDPSLSPSPVTSLNRSGEWGSGWSAASSARFLEEEDRLAAERAERAEQERKEREEEERRREEEEQKKKKKKRKGLGGLSPEKKKLLKHEVVRHVRAWFLEEGYEVALPEEVLMDLCEQLHSWPDALPPSGLLHEAELQAIVKDLHSKVAVLEEEVYDWEIKIRKQDFEINELTLKVNDTKGKFIKPVLRKVNKTESKLNKLQTKESRDFRGTLKSTGQNKFALKEDEDTSKPDWREALKHGEGEEAAES